MHRCDSGAADENLVQRRILVDNRRAAGILVHDVWYDHHTGRMVTAAQLQRYQPSGE